jgi:hypothetical protein
LEYGFSGMEFVGKRVRFKSINDPRSILRFNDLGTVTAVTNYSNWSGRQMKLWIRWDNCGNYTLVDDFDSLDFFTEAGI